MDTEQLKQKIKEKNISLHKLSTKSGVGYATLHDILNNKTQNPRIDTMSKIASALNENIENII